MLLGSLPDPINILPLSGGWRATSMAGKAAANMTRAQAIAAGARAGINTGVIEGAAGAALADAIVLPDLAARGEDVGFVDLMLDVVFGGVLGGGLGALGGGVAGYMGKRRADTLAGLEARAQQELARLEYEDLLTWQEFGTPDNDFLLRADAPEPFTQTPDNFLAPDSPLDFFGITRNDDADLVRAGLNGRDKRDIMRAVEKALADMAAGQPVDVGPVLRESHALSRAYDLVRDNPLDGQADDVLAMLEPEDLERVLVHRGPAIERDGEIVVHGRAVKKAAGSKRGFGLVKIIFGHGEKGNKSPAMPPVTREDVISLPQFVREYEPVQKDYGTSGDGVTRWNIPRDDGKHLVVVAGRGQDGSDSRLVSMYVEDATQMPSQRKIHSGSPLPSARLGEGYATGGIDVLSRTVGPNGSTDGTINPDRPTVNFATERQDGFSPAPPLREGQWAEVPEADATRTLDAELEARLADLAVQGKLDETDMALLHESAERQAMAARYEELGHAVLECVLEAE
ncbi:MAG: hypothetical protein IJD16_04380 [Desulfovibrio sp.]|nr:hypothetical protein [Desulfovibrio sp.]